MTSTQWRPSFPPTRAVFVFLVMTPSVCFFVLVSQRFFVPKSTEHNKFLNKFKQKSINKNHRLLPSSPEGDPTLPQLVKISSAVVEGRCSVVAARGWKPSRICRHLVFSSATTILIEIGLVLPPCDYIWKLLENFTPPPPSFIPYLTIPCISHQCPNIPLLSTSVMS